VRPRPSLAIATPDTIRVMKVVLFSALTLLACARETACDGTMTDDSWAAMRQCEADMARAETPA
jgi:hypothetical protein